MWVFSQGRPRFLLWAVREFVRRGQCEDQRQEGMFSRAELKRMLPPNGQGKRNQSGPQLVR